MVLPIIPSALALGARLGPQIARALGSGLARAGRSVGDHLRIAGKYAYENPLRSAGILGTGYYVGDEAKNFLSPEPSRPIGANIPPMNQFDGINTPDQTLNNLLSMEAERQRQVAPIEPPMVQPPLQQQASIGSFFPDNQVMPQRSDASKVIDRLYDFLSGASEGIGLPQMMRQGTAAMQAGIQGREASDQAIRSLMDQGFSYTDAQAMASDPKYRDQMMDKMQSDREFALKASSILGGPGGEVGKLQPGMQWIRDERGEPKYQQVIPGSPQYIQRMKEYNAAKMSDSLVEESTNTMVNDSQKIIDLFGDVKDDYYKHSKRYPNTGFFAWLLSFAPGTKQAEIANKIVSLQNALGLEQLKKLRAESINGSSGLGSLTEREMDVLQSSIAAISIYSDERLLKENLRKIQDTFKSFHKRYKENSISKYLNPDAKYDVNGNLIDSRSESESTQGDYRRVSSLSEAQSLPAGTIFYDPNGVLRRK